MLRQAPSDDAAADLDRALGLLNEIRRGERGETLRVYRPAPTMAFGQRDARLPGFAAAQEAARAAGFEPLIRQAGGRAAAYHQGCLVVDHIAPERDAIAGSRRRFASFAELFVGVFADLGLPSAIGPVPGEYCPGEFSVHGQVPQGPAVKLVGTAQRVVSGAWLFSSVLVIERAEPLRVVLTDCYQELGLDWNPETAGAAEDCLPGLTVDAVEVALLARYQLG